MSNFQELKPDFILVKESAKTIWNNVQIDVHKSSPLALKKGFTNRCIGCGKPIGDDFSACGQCSKMLW